MSEEGGRIWSQTAFQLRNERTAPGDESKHGMQVNALRLPHKDLARSPSIGGVRPRSKGSRQVAPPKLLWGHS
jgi:hypothetical protein